MLCKWLKKKKKPPVVEKSLAPSWYVVAEGEIGVREVPGDGDNPRVLEYHRYTSLKATKDSVAWCSAFVNACLSWSGVKGTNSAAARSFLAWGRPQKKPELGSITIFWRVRKDGWQGHVGFFLKEQGNYIYVLGGNQSDEVNIQGYHKSKLLGYRWPV